MSEYKIPTKGKIILDVRTDAEYQAERIKGSIDIPLSFIEMRKWRIAELLKGREVLIMCRTGIRAELAKQILSSHCKIEKLEVFPWGIVEYKKQFPDQIITGIGISRLPIMRQVQLTAGWLIVLLSILWFFIHIYFFLGVISIGWGLIFSWITGRCALAFILKKLPFNK